MKKRNRTLICLPLGSQFGFRLFKKSESLLWRHLVSK